MPAAAALLRLSLLAGLAASAAAQGQEQPGLLSQAVSALRSRVGTFGLFAPPSPPPPKGNPRCWAGHFNYDHCCAEEFGDGGNPDCWDKRRYTHQRCCINTDEEIPPSRPLNPHASKRWRVTCGKDVGGWMVHELTFFEDDACEQRVRKYARMIDSGHRKTYAPKHAFDQWVKSTDEYFWYSMPAPEPGDAWLGLEMARPTEVKCVTLWHNNIPSVPVTLQRSVDSGDGSAWIDVGHWPAALGGTWVSLVPGREAATVEGRAHEL